RRQLWQAIQALTPPLREAVVLRYLGEMRFKDVAEALNCNPKTAESRARLGIEAIRRYTQVNEIEWQAALHELAAW
ncbi:MAG: RNA polymerase sigma factor, partial [Anaerolineales bacterium]